jgi:hypothetical protein
MSNKSYTVILNIHRKKRGERSSKIIYKNSVLTFDLKGNRLNNTCIRLLILYRKFYRLYKNKSMSNSSTIIFFQFVTQQITIYFGLFILITGVFGDLLNILVFTTLNTFRNTPCVFYLTIASVVNAGQLLTSLLIRILSIGFYIDPTTTSWFCKIRVFLVQYCAVVSLTCTSLATIDQFISMTHRRLSSLQLAHRHIILACIISSIHGIFFLIYFDTPNGICAIINLNFEKYFSYFYFPILLGILPVITMITFALLAFFSIRTIANRHIHIERLSRDRQLTAMVLIQVVFIVVTTVPYIISNIYSLSFVTTDQLLLARCNLINSITILFYYASSAVSFYS